MSSLENDLNLEKFLLKAREECIRLEGTPPDDGKSILFIINIFFFFLLFKINFTFNFNQPNIV